MQKITLLGVLAILCLLARAQQPALKPITVGDYLPKIILNDLLNYKSDTASLKDFKGKMVILDFWSPYCKSCIKAMPKLDSLQNVFKENVQFIMVTEPSNDALNSKAITKVFDKRKSLGLFVPSFPVTGTGNNLLTEIFPHDFVPYYVFINSRGRVCAVTSYQLMNAETIQTLIRIK
jgi:thiol-disulfide isomerase/thioredoxin